MITGLSCCSRCHKVAVCRAVKPKKRRFVFREWVCQKCWSTENKK